MGRRPPTHVVRLFISAMALVIGTSATAAAQTPDSVAYLVKPSASPCLRFRDEPDADLAATDCLPPGTRVIAVESIPYWRRVVLADGRDGWVSKQYLELAPAAEAPTAIPSDAWLEVHFVDVGQGDAIWIHTWDDGVDGNGIFEGRNIVIDGGPDTWAPANQLVAYLLERAHPGAVIDALIVTHPHSDHYYGARGVLRDFQVRTYYDPGQPSDNSTYQALLAEVRSETADGAPARVHLGAGQFGVPDWGREVTAEFLYAWPGDGATDLGSGGTEVNNASIVLRLAYGAHSFLFVGDLEGKHRGDAPDSARFGEARLLRDIGAARLRSTVLKAGHHGSETSSTLPFLQAVNPEIVVVSSGRKSFSGTFLPDASVLQRFCGLGAVRVVRTDHDDAADGLTASSDTDADHVVIRTNGTQIEVRAFSAGQPITVPAC